MGILTEEERKILENNKVLKKILDQQRDIHIELANINRRLCSMENVMNDKLSKNIQENIYTTIKDYLDKNNY